MLNDNIDGKLAQQAKLESLQKDDDSFGSDGWWDLPMKKRFVDERRQRLESNQRIAFMNRFKFKSGQDALDEFAHFMTELMNDEVHDMVEYGKNNKLESNYEWKISKFNQD